MPLLSDRDLLQVWEWGENQHPVDLALMLLAAAFPDIAPEQLAKLSIGQRDTLLLSLREQTFGSQLASVATCPNCGDRLELNFNVAEIRVSPETEPEEVLSMNVADYQVRFRLPNSLDLAAIAGYLDPIAAQQKLLENCLLEANRNGEPQSVQELPSNVVAAIAERMEEADPQADVQLAIACPACTHQWQATFDIVSYFWREINARSQRILQEVHALALAYGWREADILAMSPRRRQLYLEMLGQ
jgi:T4 bacteriophage base plate protein